MTSAKALTAEHADRAALAAHVGARVKELRVRSGLTQAALAARMGVRRGDLAMAESSRPQWTLLSLAKAAAALGCSLSDLVEGFDIAQLSFALSADNKSAKDPCIAD